MMGHDRWGLTNDEQGLRRVSSLRLCVRIRNHDDDGERAHQHQDAPNGHHHHHLDTSNDHQNNRSNSSRGFFIYFITTLMTICSLATCMEPRQHVATQRPKSVSICGAPPPLARKCDGVVLHFRDSPPSHPGHPYTIVYPPFNRPWHRYQCREQLRRKDWGKSRGRGVQDVNPS